MATDNIIAILCAVVVLVVILASSIRDTQPSKAIKKFTTVAFNIVTDHIQLLATSKKEYNTFDDYLNELIPIACKELKTVIDKSGQIDDIIKKLITDDMIKMFMVKTINLYDEELRLTFDSLKEQSNNKEE